MDGKTKLRVAGVVALFVAAILAHQLLSAMIETKAEGWGPLGAALILGLVVAVFMLVVLSVKQAAHNLETMKAMNQDNTKNDITALAGIATEAYKASIEASTANWNQQRMEAAARERRLELMARENQRQIMMIARMLGGASAVGMGQPMEEEQPTSMMEPSAYDEAQLSSPDLTETLRTYQKVEVGKGHGQRYKVIDNTQVVAKYGPDVVTMAQRILDECWFEIPFNFEAIKDRVGSKSTRQVQQALDMLAEMGRCDPKGQQGQKRLWRDPANPNRPQPPNPLEDPALIALNGRS